MRTHISVRRGAVCLFVLWFPDLSPPITYSWYNRSKNDVHPELFKRHFVRGWNTLRSAETCHQHLCEEFIGLAVYIRSHKNSP